MIFLTCSKQNPDNFQKFVAKANIASWGEDHEQLVFFSQVSHHERALVNDLQSVSKKLSETRSRIGLKSMKINVGSPKTIQKKTLQTKNITEKKPLQKKTLHTNTA